MHLFVFVCLTSRFIKGYIPIPKSSSKERIVANTHIFDFELADDEMRHLDTLDEGE